jgi:hypothetical protein
MSTDPQSLLLENIATSLASGANMEDILAQMSETDPRLGLVAKYLATKRAAADEVNDENDEEDVLEPEHPKPRRPRMADSSAPAARERVEAVRSLQRLARTMFAEIEELRSRNDQLASALGACYLCWGEDPQCEVCNGEGVPGAFEPDKQLFSKLVGPAARRLRNSRADSFGTDATQPRNVTERTN